MKFTSRVLAGTCAAGVAACLIACGVPVPPTATKYDSPENTRPAVAKEAVAGGAFNKFFPKQEGDYSLAFAAEKKGYAEAAVSKAGADVATLYVYDALSDPAKADELKAATDKFEGHPYMKQGKHGSKILVQDRFQVKVQGAPEANLTEDQRKEWLKKFDLTGLANLNK